MTADSDLLATLKSKRKTPASDPHMIATTIWVHYSTTVIRQCNPVAGDDAAVVGLGLGGPPVIRRFGRFKERRTPEKNHFMSYASKPIRLAVHKPSRALWENSG